MNYLQVFECATVFDLIGNYNGTLTNGPQFIQSLNGGAMYFDGVASYIDLPTSSLISGTNAFTVEVMYKSVTIGAVIGNYGTRYTSNAVWIFQGGIYLNNSNGYIPSYAARVPGHHCITVTRNLGGYVNVYFDGNLEISNTLNTASIPTTINWRIGRDVVSGAEAIVGHIYSIRVYNRDLSQTEVTRNYMINKKRLGI